MEVLTTPKKISLLQRIRPYWYAAAMVVLILSIGVFFFQSRKIEEQKQAKNGRDRVQQRHKQNIGRRDQRRYDCRLYPGGYGLVG